MSHGDDVIWHDLEHCGYRADLPAWLGLAGAAGPGPVVELGAGTGRVSHALAAAGHRVVAIDREPTLLAALRARVAPGARLETLCADVTQPPEIERPALIVAPALLIQMVGGSGDRSAVLRWAARSLRPGGWLACSCDASLPRGNWTRRVSGTTRRASIRGQVWSTEVEAVTSADSSLVLARRRSRALDRRERSDECLTRLSVESLAAEAIACGLEQEAMIEVAATGRHSGVTIGVFGAR